MTSKKPSDKASSKKQAPPASPPSPPPASSGGLKVQVIYLAARSGSAKSPAKDALWFATYPIIPRTGDCLFRDGMYYRVERVFLYENTAPGWCADIEVSYYGRR
ncbi:hypothetical protein [Pseudanabaena sp. FACHB-2040]|uniref:hypothetical protein n=1 Tax=Pseudanabaena sp. FACHB-2040 TaxID=2692859 RepID=UPI001687C2A4|nr:hypothetical protein [Pseudanabaena sp. FACHB-2040]MBD2259720.1 hypothetical protein [Pseudanabaena sp. FACHB-2040]